MTEPETSTAIAALWEKLQIAMREIVNDVRNEQAVFATPEDGRACLHVEEPDRVSLWKWAFAHEGPVQLGHLLRPDVSMKCRLNRKTKTIEVERPPMYPPQEIRYRIEIKDGTPNLYATNGDEISLRKAAEQIVNPFLRVPDSYLILPTHRGGS